MIRSLIFPAILCLVVASPLHAGEKTVKVLILAGQSNMEGKAPNALLERQATDPKTRELFTHLRKDDKWIVRDDVFVKFFDRHGPLTIGFGSPGRTGVELEFGTLMGNHFEEPVILVKTAWGGHSLFKHFRSPSAKYPAVEVLQKELQQMQANVKKSNQKNKKNAPLPTMDNVKSQYGTSYRKMMAEVKDVMDNYATLFPALKGEKKLEVAGFVWFQGWNDQYGAQDEYASNMRHFINDVRKDLRVPKLPFVIGVMGQNGSKPATGAMLTIQKAQLSMNDVPEFKGNVKAVRTDVLVDKAAEDLFPTWRKNPEQWNKVGGDFPYHYLGSAIWFNRIGKAMGESMLNLIKNQRQGGASDQKKPVPRKIIPGKAIVPTDAMRRIWGELLTLDFKTRTGTFRNESNEEVMPFTVLPYAELLVNAAFGDLQDFRIGERAIFRLHQNDGGKWVWLTYIQSEMNFLNGHKEYYWVDRLDSAKGQIGYTQANADKSFIRGKNLILETDEQTRYWKNGKPAKFADLQVGDKLRARSHGIGKGKHHRCWEVFIDDSSLEKFQKDQQQVHSKRLAQEGWPGYIDEIGPGMVRLTLFLEGRELAEELKVGRAVRVAAAGVDRKGGKSVDGIIKGHRTVGNLHQVTITLKAAPLEALVVTGVARLWLP